MAGKERTRENSEKHSRIAVVDRATCNTRSIRAPDHHGPRVPRPCRHPVQTARNQRELEAHVVTAHAALADFTRSVIVRETSASDGGALPPQRWMESADKPSSLASPSLAETVAVGGHAGNRRRVDPNSRRCAERCRRRADRPPPQRQAIGIEWGDPEFALNIERPRSDPPPDGTTVTGIFGRIAFGSAFGFEQRVAELGRRKLGRQFGHRIEMAANDHHARE